MLPAAGTTPHLADGCILCQLRRIGLNALLGGAPIPNLERRAPLGKARPRRCIPLAGGVQAVKPASAGLAGAALERHEPLIHLQAAAAGK